MSKLRKALSEAGIALSLATHSHLTEDDAKEFLAVVEDALKEPVLNCEVGTVEEQCARWDKHCQSMCERCSECSLHKNYFDLTAKCYAKWVQMPYEKGKTDEQ
jgi:hypothetical protein